MVEKKLTVRQLMDKEIRDKAIEECAMIAEGFKIFATHNPHCQEIANELRAFKDGNNRMFIFEKEKQNGKRS